MANEVVWGVNERGTREHAFRPQPKLIVLSAYDLYKSCAADRKYHDLNAEYGFTVAPFWHYLGYSEERWRYRGEG